MQGHIHKRVHSMADGRTVTTWYVVIELDRDANGRRRQKWHGSYRTRREAEAARAKLVNEVNTGLYAEPTKLTLADWVNDSWLTTMKSQVKASTWDGYDRMLRLHVLPTLGQRPIHQLNSTLLNNLYTELLESGNRRGAGGGLNPKTVRHVHTTLHKVLADSIDAGVLVTNPADQAKPPKPRATSRTEMKFWEPEQLARFLTSVEGTRQQAAWHLAAMTGMRRGEVLGLRWQDVDLDARRLAVRHTLVSVKYQICDSTPKTHQARTIDLDPATVDQLRAHRQRQATERAAWGPGYQESGLVFRREDGSSVHPDLFSQAFEAEVRRSGLPRIRLHDLRHTHATIALRAGAPIKVISERLGHFSGDAILCGGVADQAS
ncbi:MAG: tyrosine-type recombinase/integrase [Candidatus Dormibacteria bacterium]